MIRLLALVVALAVTGTAAASAQPNYPARAITLIVPFPPGGSTDVIARVVAEGMRGVLGQPVIVENRAGAGGSIGTAAIAKAMPDGYTIGMGTASTLAINPAVYRALSYDVLTDLAPVSNVVAVPNVLSIHPGLPAGDLGSFVKYARARPGTLSYASAGNGSGSHLLGEQLKLATGTDILHVPYRGVGPALNDAIGGQVQVMPDNLPTSLPHILGGRLRPLAVSGPTRVDALPQVPTFAELALGDLNWMSFFGLVAPARTPPAAIARLNDALAQVLAHGAGKRLAAQQAIVVAKGADAFAAEIRRELARMRRAVAAAGIALN
jgi:tripartite-type tricarboxylate transporter receptor subunit TctC